MKPFWLPFLVLALSAPGSAAPSPPKKDDLEAALATIAAHVLADTSSELFFSLRAGDLNDLTAQLQRGPGVESLERKSACLRVQLEVPLVLKRLRDDAVLQRRDGREPITLAPIEPIFWRQVRELVHVQLDPSSQTLRLVGTGVGPALGEEWSIEETGPATRTRNGCDDVGTPAQRTAPSEDELVRALTTLSKTTRPGAQPRADPATLGRVVVGVVGASVVLHSSDEQKARLKRLAKRVRAAGGDLVPILQPQFDEVERDKCLEQAEVISDRMTQLMLAEMQGDPITLPETFGPYVIDRLGQWKPDEHHDLIARGFGPMKGDVWTTERGYPTAKTHFCEQRKAPPIGN